MKVTRAQVRDLVDQARRVFAFVVVTPDDAQLLPVTKRSAHKLLLKAFNTGQVAEPAEAREVNLTTCDDGDLLIG